jgi:hypothetical protein
MRKMSLDGMQLRRGSTNEFNHRAGVMQPLAGVTAQMNETQDWHACRIM